MTWELTVCYFGTYRAAYSRNQIMIAGLRSAGVKVIECHVPLWHGIQDRVQAASGGWLKPSFWRRVIRTYWQLLVKYRRVPEYDMMIVGYPGQIDIFLARVLTWLRHKPVVLDVFMSIYLIATERKLVAKSPLTGKLIRKLENWACLLPERLIIDTPAYRSWFIDTYQLKPEDFRLVPTGADDRVFQPVASPKRRNGFRLIHYGTYLPGTGVNVIIDSAKLLEAETDIHFELFGEGALKREAVAQAEKLGLKNITFHGWIDKEDIPERVAEADVCLGVFAKAEQSERTVVNKAYEALAMAKPLITGESATVREHISDGYEALLVERDSPQALAEAILTLRNDPVLCTRLGEQGHALYKDRYSIAVTGKIFRGHLEEILWNHP